GFAYDGFGNLTSKVLGGATTTFPVDPVTNQLTNTPAGETPIVLSNVSYDLNGNLTSVTDASAPTSGLTLTYDGFNRVESARVGSGGTEYYGYDAANHRVHKLLANGTEEFTLYGAHGERLGTYNFYENCDDPDDANDCRYQMSVLTSNVWFAGKLLWSGTARSAAGPVFADRLGTNGARFRPYGDEITSTSNDRVKFGTYT